MEHEKDYSLLRPFDRTAAENGGSVCNDIGERMRFVSQSDSGGQIFICEYASRMVGYFGPDQLRMTPMFWLEGRPVYKGDEPYYMGNKRRVTGMVSGFVEIDGSGGVLVPLEELTWTPPKVKREGWVNVYPKAIASTLIYATKEEADVGSGDCRIACIRIEWEEPAA